MVPTLSAGGSPLHPRRCDPLLVMVVPLSLTMALLWRAMATRSLRTADEDASVKANRISELEGLVRQLNSRLEEEKGTRLDVEHRWDPMLRSHPLIPILRRLVLSESLGPR